jgi:hypothetical protein
LADRKNPKLFKPVEDKVEAWKICSIKAFSFLVLQYVLQAYGCAYFMQKDYISDIFEDLWYPPIIAVLLWVSVIVFISSMSKRLKGRSGLYIPLYIFYIITQLIFVITVGIKLGKCKSTFLVSIM